MRISVILVAAVLAGCSDSDESPSGPIDARPLAADANLGLLSQAGLYSDFAAREIASDLVEFTPNFILWSDGLVKRRWLRLPAGTAIDTSDMNHWVFPVGTQLWKEFATQGGKVLETRLIERVGAADYRLGAYLWNDGQTEATYTTNGAMNVLGTDHDVPNATECITCHRGEQGRILGFSAIQLDPAVYPQVRFTVAPRDAGYRPSFDAPLGYLHANCGNCHNPNGSAASATGMLLRLDIADADTSDPAETAMYQSIVDVPTEVFRVDQDCVGGKMRRIAPHNLECSALYLRMMTRGGAEAVQMPPIASKHPDLEAVDALAAWIGDL